MKTPSYSHCAACSPAILSAYESGGWEFVRRAVSEGGYVEEVSGLAEVQRKALEAEKEMEGWSEEEEGDGEVVGGEGEMV